MSDRKVAGWAGIGAFLFLLGTTFLGGEFPDMDAAPAEIVDYFSDAPNWSYSGQVLILVFVLVFASAFYSVLRPTPAGNHWSSPLLLISSVILGASVLGALAAETALMVRADGGSEEGVSALLALSNMGFMWAVGGMSLFLFAAWLSTRAAGFPSWLSYVALVGAICAFVGLFFGASDPVGADESFFGILGFIGFILWGVWMLLAGIVLLRSESTPVEA